MGFAEPIHAVSLSIPHSAKELLKESDLVSLYQEF